jgi:hypothetical protein
VILKKARHQMQTIRFTMADGKECQGYPLTWKGLSFGIARDRIGSSSYWRVIELQTGCSGTTKQSSTKKEAVREALDILNRKGIKTVRSRLREVFAERGSIKVKGKIKTVHCNSPGNWLRTLCGRVKSDYCLPVKYLGYAKKPCKKCQQLARKD